jgi:hypothetical protein
MAAEGHAVMLACGVLAVSESGFYAQRHRPPSARAIRHAGLTELIGRVHLESRGTYGARRVHAELTLGHGLSVGRCAVESLMRRAGIAGVSGRPRFRRIPNVATASDLVERRFWRDEPDRLSRHRHHRAPDTGGQALWRGRPRRLEPSGGGLVDRLGRDRRPGHQRPRDGHRGTSARWDGDPLGSGHRSSRRGHSRGERSTRGSCPRWVRSAAVSTTR